MPKRLDEPQIEQFWREGFLFPIDVFDAKQAAHFYKTALGFQSLAYSGLETGVKDRTSYVIEQDKIRLVFTTPMLAEKSEILDHVRMNKPGQGFYKVLAESALRAIRLCQPLRVPTTGYERWKDLQLNFDAREMLEG